MLRSLFCDRQDHGAPLRADNIIMTCVPLLKTNPSLSERQSDSVLTGPFDVLSPYLNQVSMFYDLDYITRPPFFI